MPIDQLLSQHSLIALVLGFIAGIFFVKAFFSKSSDSDRDHPETMNNLAIQIAEIKERFSEMERARERIEKERIKTEEERNKRFIDFIEGNAKLFKELKESVSKSDEEKEKRIAELIARQNELFQKYSERTEKFLEKEGKSRQEIEKQRDAQIADMRNIVQQIARTFSGTKSSGIAGEVFLKEVLKNSIKAKVVVTDLKTDRGVIEFAWNLRDGKFIPIDSKVPDVSNALHSYSSEESETLKKEAAKRVLDKARKEVERVKKYQNLSNTIDSCILVFPEAVLEIAPEIISFGAESNVFVCSYKDVFPVAMLLQDRYFRLKEEGDIGRYKIVLNELFSIIDKIAKKTEAIEKAAVTISNANAGIKGEIVKARRNSELS